MIITKTRYTSYSPCCIFSSMEINKCKTLQINNHIIWATSCENLPSDLWTQQTFKSVCMQSLSEVRFYSPVKPVGSCWAQPVDLLLLFLGRLPFPKGPLIDWLIVLRFNDTSTLVSHFVSSPRERVKSDRPLSATRIASLAQLYANISWTHRWRKIHNTFATPDHPHSEGTQNNFDRVIPWKCIDSFLNKRSFQNIDKLGSNL